MASIEEANLLFKNLVTYEKSVVMAKKYVKYHKAVIKDLKRLEKLEKTIEILKDKIELPLENDFDVVNKDDIHLYRLRTKCLINEKEYELLKEVLGND